MSDVATVRMQPSGHEFIVEPGETLLESALRSGLSVRYSCNSGTCGECKARLVSGKLGEQQPHDYVLTEREKADCQFLMCRTMAGSDMEIEAIEAGGIEDIPRQEISTSLFKLRTLADDVMELQIRTPRSKTLWFLAGQHVKLRINDLPASQRSIASCPCDGMLLRFHVGRDSEDPFADYIFNEAKMRAAVEVEGPFGNLVLDEDSGRPLVFIAYETGFAAVKSLIEHAISLDLAQPVRLYWLVGRPESHYLANFCRSWQEVMDDYAFVPMVANARSPLFDRMADGDVLPENVIERDLLQVCLQVTDDTPDLSGYDVYVSGVASAVDPGRQVLLRHGLPGDRLFINNLEGC